MITATTWVPKGFAAQFPKRIDVTEEELERIADLARLQLEDAQGDLDDARAAAGESDEGGVEAEEEVVVGEMEVEANGKGKKKKKAAKKTAEDKEDIDDDLKEYDLENYDEPTEEERIAGESMGMFGNIKGLAFHQPGEADPYITMAELSDDEEREELQILPTDNLLLVAKTEDDVCHLEVYVYEDDDSNLYVHHDIMLPAIPLCVEWLDLPVGDATATANTRGNYVAIGTMDPDIEIWNLDTVDSLYPNAILGAPTSTTASSVLKAKKQKKHKKKRTPTPTNTHHVDSILSLSINRHHRNLLASASADTTVKLWDLTTTTCAHSYNHHTDKVCALSWHPVSTTTLLSGSYDRTVVWADLRAPAAAAPRWGVETDVEDVRWDPHNADYFYVTTEGGCIHRFDSRSAPATPGASRPVWTLQAHDRSVSSFDVSAWVPGLMVSGGMDKTVKVWNTEGGAGPSMVVSRDLGVGKVFSTRFAPEEPVAWRVSVAGSKGIVTVWDLGTNAGVRRTFAGRAVLPGGAAPGGEERVVAVESSGESDSEDGEEQQQQQGEEGAGGEVDRGRDGWESMDEEE